MGRIFETRKATMFARWNRMAKTFTRISKEIVIAIKRASGQEHLAYETVLYEGYGPHGIAMVVETATDNVVRTVANVRMHFKNHGGHLGNSGSVAFQFQRMGVFR